MVLYRRNRVEGGTYFFTVTLRDRSSRLLVDCISQLRTAYAQAQKRLPFETVAIVILPDHLHAIWALPAEDSDYSGRWRLIKASFSRSVAKAGLAERRAGTAGYDLWQSRFWEHTIRDDDDLKRHVDYIHYNPVKHGLVTKAADWPHSSFHGFVERGELSTDWAGDLSSVDGMVFGE
ncbi:REP-associated tyrosine transposase [Nevskia soli]|uniref:REP-associated tyrosine transposase n=1 Tax=Nevskia soli TaxID=418856 RepID=UPI0004A6AE42|nr:transposase [Nevskia soli]